MCSLDGQGFDLNVATQAFAFLVDADAVGRTSGTSGPRLDRTVARNLPLPLHQHQVQGPLLQVDEGFGSKQCFNCHLNIAVSGLQSQGRMHSCHVSIDFKYITSTSLRIK